MSALGRRRLARRTATDRRATAFGDAVGRATRGSDRLIPLEHPLPVAAPDGAELRRQVVAFVDAAAEAGALDAGTAAFVDAWIGAHLDGWLAQLEEEHRRRLDVAGWILGGRLELLAAAHGRLDDLRTRIAELETEQRRLRSILRGERPDAAPAPAATPVASPGELLTATLLDGLRLAERVASDPAPRAVASLHAVPSTTDPAATAAADPR